MIPKRKNPAVSAEILEKIFIWKQSGAEDNDILERLRLQTVPSGYSVQSWTPGMFDLFNCIDQTEVPKVCVLTVFSYTCTKREGCPPPNIRRP